MSPEFSRTKKWTKPPEQSFPSPAGNYAFVCGAGELMAPVSRLSAPARPSISRVPADARIAKIIQNAETLAPLKAQLNEMRLLPQNWNGMNSPSPNNDALYEANRLLNALPSFRLMPDRVTPSAEGGVGICFRHETRFASIECLNSGDIIGLTSDGAGDIEAWDIHPSFEGMIEALDRIRGFFKA